MSARHTPGPWSCLTLDTHIEIRAADGKLVAVVGDAAADARLIAAAPKLAAHLSFAIDLLSRIPVLSGTAQVDAMRAALAEAIRT